VGLAVFCAHACQALLFWSELTKNTAKTRMGYISSPSIFNAIIGKTSYCVILKMVTLHDAIKTIGVFVFFLKKE